MSIYLGLERDFGSFEWVLIREMDVQEKDSTSVRATLGTNHDCFPMEETINKHNFATFWRISLEILVLS